MFNLIYFIILPFIHLFSIIFLFSNFLIINCIISVILTINLLIIHLIIHFIYLYFIIL